MTVILSWNIQNGKGVDGGVSLERIASVITDMSDPDIICLQEVSRHLRIGGTDEAPDQIAELQALFPGYEVVFGAAVEASRDGRRPRWQFGNATLTRLPVLSVFHHQLPQPPAAGLRHMPRQAIEMNVAAGERPLRVVNTHLEYHSEHQRLTQIARLRALHAEIVANVSAPPSYDKEGSYQFLDRPESCIVCGDFNMEVDCDAYQSMLAPVVSGLAPFLDAWRLVNHDQPHEPTCGVHDFDQWPKGAHCRDFFFVSGDVSRSVKSVSINTETAASDHQPLVLTIADAA